MLERGRKLKNKGYLSTDSIFRKWPKNTVTIKSTLSPGMKRSAR